MLKVRSVELERDDLPRERLQRVADEFAAHGQLSKGVPRFANRRNIAGGGFTSLHRAPVLDLEQTLIELIALGCGCGSDLGSHPQNVVEHLPIAL